MSSKWDYNNASELRHTMVIEQLKYRGLDHPNILQVFEEIPRHLFIPHVSLEEAYGDHPIPINAGQTISQPYIVALMLYYLDLQKEHRVLEVGSGSGYATALLSKLSQHVDALEFYGELFQDSKAVLDQLDLHNISLYHRSAWEQIETEMVYDRIILWASPPKVPEHLFDILKENGIMVAPEGKREQYVWVYQKSKGQIKKIRRDAVRFVPLVQGPIF